MQQSGTATTTANICPLTCSRRQHRHGFFHGSATSGRGGGDTWTGGQRKLGSRGFDTALRWIRRRRSR